MRLDYILRRDDGSRIKITVDLSMEYGRDAKYTFSVFSCKKRKSTWNRVVQENFSHRTMSYQEKQSFFETESMNFITEDELMSAKLKLWNSIKPD